MERNYLITMVQLILAFALVVSCCVLIELLFFHHETIVVGHVMGKVSNHRLIVYTGSQTITAPARVHSWEIVAQGDQVGVICLVGNVTQIRYKCRVSLAGE